jgi:stearoyl-CoA desaturase (delta-9 desaturase)
MIDLTLIGFVSLLFAYLHVTGVIFSIYSHRCLSHRLIVYHTAVEKFFRFWLWITIGVQNNFKTASHMQHHRYTDRAGDPHSVHVSGWYHIAIRRLAGAFAQLVLFMPRPYGQTDDYPKKYGVDYAWDYTTLHPAAGRVIFLVANTLLFGSWGLALFVFFYVAEIFLLMGVADVGGHSIGYRNHDIPNKSTNVPFCFFLLGGEEYHNNHHARSDSVNLAHRWYEFDVGYAYIMLLTKLRLATVR